MHPSTFLHFFNFSRCRNITKKWCQKWATSVHCQSDTHGFLKEGIILLTYKKLCIKPGEGQLQILGQIQLQSPMKPNKCTWTSGQTQWGQFGAQPIWCGCWNESLMQNSQITNNANSRVSNFFRPERCCSAFHLSQIEEHVWHKGISSVNLYDSLWVCETRKIFLTQWWFIKWESLWIIHVRLNLASMILILHSAKKRSLVNLLCRMYNVKYIKYLV